MKHSSYSKTVNLATITETELREVIEDTGREAVSAEDAMEHVKDMLVEYSDLDEDDFEEHTDDDMDDAASVAGVVDLDEEDIDFGAMSDDDSDDNKTDDSSDSSDDKTDSDDDSSDCRRYNR